LFLDYANLFVASMYILLAVPLFNVLLSVAIAMVASVQHIYRLMKKQPAYVSLYASPHHLLQIQSIGGGKTISTRWGWGVGRPTTAMDARLPGDPATEK
jgi:hypothetical protein